MTAITAAFALLGFAVGALWGLHQAQVMVKPTNAMHNHDWWNAYRDRLMDTLIRQFDLGPRGHRWSHWYHAINAGLAVALAALSILLWEHGGVLSVLLAGAFAWLAEEPAYSYGLHREWINPNRENINFGDLVDPDEGKIIVWIREHWDSKHPVTTWNLFMTLVRLALVIILLGVTL